MRAKTIGILAALLCGASVFSFSAETRADYELIITEFPSPPRIDGILDNPIWDRATLLDNFTQFEPQEGAQPSEKTVGYIGYDKDNLYIAFRCFDSNPNAVRANLSQRDISRSDDGITIYLDTFNDKKRAFVFEVNPRGIQSDGVYTEVRRMGGGRGGGGGGGGFDMYDRNWDTYFLADARIDDKGYAVEIAIPFKSLRFPHTPTQVWGLQVMRTIKRKNEEIYWYPRTRNINGFLIQTGQIQFSGMIEKGKNLELMPVTTGSKIDEGKFEPQAGINVKYGITSDLTADMTYNPDFSQIEADMPQINVNQRYDLYYPEKRPFFLEGKDLFDTPFELVYTRKIVDPQYGFKLSGKMGKTTLGVLSTLDENPPDIIFPEVPEGVFLESSNRSWTNIFRMRQDLFAESYIGLIFTDKEMGTSYNGLFKNHNRVTGVDGNFKFLNYYRFAFQVLGSQSKVGSETTDIVPAVNFNLSHQSRHVSFSADWNSLPPDFEAGTGFFRRKDINALSSRIGYAFLPMNEWIVSINSSVEYRRIYDFSRVLTDEEFTFNLMVSGWRQSHIFINCTTGLEQYEGVNFRGSEVRLNMSSEPFSWLSGNISMSFGDGIYYSEDSYLGWKTGFGTRMTFRPLTNLRFFYNIQNNEFYKKRGGEKVYEINLISQRITYQVSKPLSVRLITDYNDYYKKLYLSFLISYEYRPGTVFYLGIDDNQERDASGIFRGTGRYYFVKFSYWWRM